MATTVIFAHFGASAVTLALRYLSRPFLNRVSGCLECFSHCMFRLRRCDLCCKKSREGKVFDCVFFFSGGRGLLKWYWFHLAVQVGFAFRECLVISDLNGWTLKVILVQIAYWLTIIVVTFEVWNFSKVRCQFQETEIRVYRDISAEEKRENQKKKKAVEKQIKAVDGLLDMLLLPVNMVFFCAVCVRALELQPGSHLEELVPEVIESPDIYEAFALWSVLELFVQVVKCKKEEMNEDSGAFKPVKMLTRQGVKAWVLTQFLVVFFKLFLNGIVAIYFPTVCFWLSRSCTTCAELYENNVAMALTVLTFVLCSFAIGFVFTFEASFKKQLHDIEPVWKFLGVKGIVSVTYGQSIGILILGKVFGWDAAQQNLLHCLLYGLWMPILALIHSCLAYPYKKKWLTVWLDLIKKEGQDTCEAAASVPHSSNSSEDDLEVLSHSGLNETIADVDSGRIPASVIGEEADHPAAREEAGARTEPVTSQSPIVDHSVQEEIHYSAPLDEVREVIAPSPPPGPPAELPATTAVPSARDTEHIRDGLVSSRGDTPRGEASNHSAAVSYCKLLWYAIIGALACFVSRLSILSLVPPENQLAEVALYNRTCNEEGDLAHYLQRVHLGLSNETESKFQTKGVAGVWLPLCATATLTCLPGRYAPTRHPSVKCGFNGRYEVDNACTSISCESSKLPDISTATRRAKDMQQQNWTYGVVIHYDCKPGYVGQLSATCTERKEWNVTGGCTEKTCDPPPPIPNAKPLANTSINVSTGVVIRYQCDDMFNGTPTATCGNDGNYVTEGRCKRECRPPPEVEHAVADFDNLVASAGWFEGMRCPYVCVAGYEGNVTAVCREAGNYTVAGKCVRKSCGQPPKLPHATPVLADVMLQRLSVNNSISYKCDYPRFKGKLTAVCSESGRWRFSGKCDEVTCGLPLANIPHARPVVDPSRAHGNISIGQVVRYQCDNFYNGTPTAVCGDDSLYVTQGRCKRECKPPPSIDNAAPLYDTAILEQEWIEGVLAQYKCNQGYAGSVTAKCGPDGNYTIEGKCEVASFVQTEHLNQKVRGLSVALGVENVIFAGAAASWLWWRWYKVRLCTRRCLDTPELHQPIDPSTELRGHDVERQHDAS